MMSDLNVGDTVAHTFSEIRGKILEIRDDEQGYNYAVEWFVDRDDHRDWYKREVLVQLTDRPTPASDETDNSLDAIFSKPAGKEAFYLEGEIRPKLEPLIATAVQAESRKLLERLQGFLEVDKDTSEPLPEAESEWNEAINYAYKRLLDSEQQKLGEK